jgi:hypothetical protein
VNRTSGAGTVGGKPCAVREGTILGNLQTIQLDDSIVVTNAFCDATKYGLRHLALELICWALPWVFDAYVIRCGSILQKGKNKP